MKLKWLCASDDISVDSITRRTFLLLGLSTNDFSVACLWACTPRQQEMNGVKWFDVIAAQKVAGLIWLFMTSLLSLGTR